MTGGLIIRLRPGEKFLINGVVLENGARRTQIRVRSQDANILRMRDALHPDEANTPVKRLYYQLQIIITGDEKSPNIPSLTRDLKALYDSLPEPECRKTIEKAQFHLDSGKFYQAMKALKNLLPFEERLLQLAHAKTELSMARRAV